MVRRCIYLFIAALFILVLQSLKIAQISLKYRALYSLVNSSFPDTFWHEYYKEPLFTARRASKVSLVDESVIVLACGRDVAAALPGFRRNLYLILKLFNDYRVVLGESDSKDSTLLDLQEWRDQDGKVQVYSFGELRHTYSENRAHRIAFCRNSLLNISREIETKKKFRFLLVIDIDINASPILTVDNFLSNFEYNTSDWAVMTTSQTKVYYDVWAVRSDTLNYDCWKVVDPLPHQTIARKIYVYVHTKPIPRDFGLIPVHSAFGGFGVYQTAYLNNCYYEAFDKDNKQKCEHVSFHACVRKNGGKIFINPKFQNADGVKN
jgi:hypothetical protein